MKCGDFIFDGVHLLYQKCHKINFKHGVSYINSRDWIKNKKRAINFINRNDNRCFQYAATVPQEISQLKPFINKYNLDGIKQP